MDRPRQTIPGRGHTRCQGPRPAGKEPGTSEDRKDSHSGRSAEDKGGQATWQVAGKQCGLQLDTPSDPSHPEAPFQGGITGKSLDSGVSQMGIQTRVMTPLHQLCYLLMRSFVNL